MPGVVVAILTRWQKCLKQVTQGIIVTRTSRPILRRHRRLPRCPPCIGDRWGHGTRPSLPWLPARLVALLALDPALPLSLLFLVPLQSALRMALHGFRLDMRLGMLPHSLATRMAIWLAVRTIGGTMGLVDLGSKRVKRRHSVASGFLPRFHVPCMCESPCLLLSRGTVVSAMPVAAATPAPVHHVITVVIRREPIQKEGTHGHLRCLVLLNTVASRRCLFFFFFFFCTKRL